MGGGPVHATGCARTRWVERRRVEAMQLNELARAYEARHFPPTRRLDLQGEGPETARARALRWIQSFAHEAPGTHLLLVVERGRKAGGRKGPVRAAVEQMLDELSGGLIDWWQPFAEGSLALRVADDPRRWAATARAPQPDPGDGRTDETAGRRHLDPRADVPPELLPLALRAAEIRRDRERHPVGLTDVVLREVWLEVEALAMQEEVDWEAALHRIIRREEERLLEDED